MQLFATLVLWAWLPIVILLFRDLRGYKAMAVSYVTAWLFLPTLEIPFRGFPDYSKLTATSVGIGLASLLFEGNVWLRFRPRWWDLPMVVLCLSPIASSLHNSLGIRNGFAVALELTMMWGAPYFLGRLYFDSFEKLRYFAHAIFIGGVVYIPFCLVELRMSPQFSNWVYGIEQRVGMAMRYGGWRPSVFLDNGLELGMWMTATCLMGFTLWYSGRLHKFMGISETLCLGALMVVTVLCKSTGALVLLLASLCTLVAVYRLRIRWLALGLTLIPLVYIAVRTTDPQGAMSLVSLSSSLFGADRAESLEFRFINENLLVDRAMEQMWLGWGGWGRNLVYDAWGNQSSIIDGMWIILFGEHGMLALVSFYLAFLAAPTAASLRFGQLRHWKFEEVAATLGMALFLLIYAVDCLLNAMENAVYPVALGGLTTVLATRDPRKLQAAPEVVVEQTPRISGRRQWPPRPDDELPETESIEMESPSRAGPALRQEPEEALPVGNNG